MRTFFFLGGVLFAAVAVPAACGGHVVLDGAGGAITTSGSTGGTGGGLPPGKCRSRSDCPVDSPDECLQPGGFPGCDPCLPHGMTCTADADCPPDGGAPMICILVMCTCTTSMTCASGCTSDASCPTGQVCGPTHRCAPQPCASATDCPVDFECSDGGCQRLACSADAMCTGYCVDGNCFETLGTCVGLPG